MLAEADKLAGQAENTDNGWRHLQRAANLARHAAAELEDEMLRARDGWPDV